MKKVLFAAILLIGFTSHSQCVNTTPFGSGDIVDGSLVTISTCNFLSEYSPITGINAGETYEFTVTSGGYVTVYQDGVSTTLLGNGVSPLSVTALSGGDLYAHWTVNAACVTASNCETTTTQWTSWTPPTCIPPANLSATNILTTTADLNWDAVGNAVAYTVEWGAPGFAPGTGTELGSSLGVVGLTTLATGLITSTPYQFYVMTDCGGTDGVSLWAGPFSFTSACSTVFAPYTDDAEAHAPTTTLTNSLCWNANASTGYNWNISSSNTPSTNTGPNSANSGTNFFYMEASNGNIGDQATLTSPNVDVTSLTIPMVQFYYHMTGAQIGSLNIEAWDGSTWNSVGIITGQQQASQADAWELREITLPGYTGVIQVRFVSTSAGTYEGDISLDDISIIEAPTCPTPSSVMITASGLTSATFAWTNGGTETEWELEYGPIGFSPGTGTSVLTSTNPSTISSLASNQLLQVYVSAVCTPGDSSSQTGPLAFNTFNQPYFMDWNSDCPTTGFFDISTSGTQATLSDDDEVGVGLPFPVLFQGVLMNDITIGANGGAVLGTQTGNIGYGGNFNTLPNGTLFPWGDDMHVATGGVYYEEIGTAPNRTFIVQWNNISNYPSDPTEVVTFQIQIEEATYEIYYVYDDSEFGGVDIAEDFAANADIGLSGINQDITVSTDDPVYLTNNSCVHFFYTDCPKPVSFSTSNITTTQADISWGAGSFGENNWTIIYGQAGFDPTTAGTTLTSSSTSITIPGLTQITIYDVYIYADCDPGNIQSVGLTGNFATLPNCSDVTGITTATALDSIFSYWNWVESSGIGTYPSTGFNIQYGAAGFTPNNGTVVNGDNNFSDTTIDITLGSAVTYDLYVQAVCGSDTSNYIGPISFTTPLTNNNPCAATPLLVDSVMVTFDGTFATYTPGEELIAPPATGCQMSDGWCDTIISFSTWYTFVAPNSGIVHISGTDLGFNGQIAVYETTDCSDYAAFNLIAANDDALDGSSLAPDFIVCGLETGNTYYLMHDAASEFSSGTYSLRLDTLPGQSNAGLDNTFSACKNEPIDLNQGLDSQASLGGDWYDPFSNPVTGSTTLSYELSGLFNYEYIATSDFCPNDTANIVLEVLACDWAGIEENDLEPLNIYPNPTHNVINIQNFTSDEKYDITLLDLNGKILYSSQDIIIESSNYEINVSTIHSGMYLLKIANSSGEKTFRIIKE